MVEGLFAAKASLKAVYLDMNALSGYEEKLMELFPRLQQVDATYRRSAKLKVGEGVAAPRKSALKKQSKLGAAIEESLRQKE